MGRNRNKFNNEPVRLHVLLEKEIMKKYKKFCIDKEVIMSERIRELIENDLNNNSIKDE